MWVVNYTTFYFEEILFLIMFFFFFTATIGPDDTIVSDANKQFLKSFLTKSNEHLVKMMKNEGPVHINYK